MVTLEKRPTLPGSALTMWLVRRDGLVIGLVEKFKNTRTERHPFKAYRLTAEGGPYAKRTISLNLPSLAAAKAAFN